MELELISQLGFLSLILCCFLEGTQGRGDADDFIGIAGHGTHQLSSFNQQPVTLSQMPTDAGLREQVEQTLKEEEIQPPSAENVSL